ncbi:MAG: hypothetical protein OEY24_02630 [Candidatus Bathyarchaeota archaeon]|nr:hypothetical protein [Candidatus Bathyarchaeota archaeon]MDH5494586.1 hypothetical protein [Candidatus Bathyarchaeota archaeon]
MKLTVMKSLSVIFLLTLITLAWFTKLGISPFEPLEATVTTDKSSYRYRQAVNVYGNVTYEGQQVEEGLVAIQVEDSMSQTIVLRTVPSNTTPSMPLTIETVSIIPCNASGHPKDNFARNARAYFKATVRNNVPLDESVLVVVNIFDIDLTPIGMAWVKLTIPGNQEIFFMPSMWIEDWVSTGTALATANAYEDWPKNNGYPYCPEKTANFAIEEHASQSPPPTQSTGNYELTFRIPPHEAPYSDTHFVYVGAFSQGWKALQNTTFSVEYQVPEDFDLNHIIEIYDVVKVTGIYGAKSSGPKWNPEIDLYPDGQIGIYDLVRVTGIYGSTY